MCFFKVKVWFQNRRMKWKRTKSGQLAMKKQLEKEALLKQEKEEQEALLKQQKEEQEALLKLEKEERIPNESTNTNENNIESIQQQVWQNCSESLEFNEVDSKCKQPENEVTEQKENDATIFRNNEKNHFKTTDTNTTCIVISEIT